jgi:sarcosine oxidase
MSRYDAIVVGCGAMGSAASYNLASRGLHVLNLEQYELNHELGSSHGKTRIIRTAYYEDERYVPLLRRAFESWRELESRSGTALLAMTGGLMIGRAEGELVAGVLRSARVHGLRCRRLSASEATEEFSIFKVGEPFEAVHEEEAGVLFPERCIRAFVDLAEDNGGEFRFSEGVTRWEGTKEGIEVETAKGRYSADRLVVCAGAWTGKLLDGLIPLSVERQVPFWFDHEKGPFTQGRMPVFIWEEEPRVFYYGLPDVGEGVKVARTHGGEIVHPESVLREVTSKDSAPIEGFVQRRIVGLRVPAVASTTCLYTNTPDLNFAVGLHPDDPRVAVVSACSGHGFKFAGVMGEAVADLVTTGKTKLDVGFLALGRFRS